MKPWMWRTAIVLLALVGGGFSPSPSFAVLSAAAHAEVAQDPKTITVYVTRTGQKYHRDGCRYLSRSKIPMSLAEAASVSRPVRCVSRPC